MSASVGIGVLGASSIAPAAVVEPASRRTDVRVVHIAAARPGAADRFATEHSIPRASDAYRAVLEDPDVDLVHIGLAAASHARWTVAALQAGKHVLCEKPLAGRPDEVLAMRAAAEQHGRLLVEGFHYRFHPLFAEVVAFARSGAAGAIRSMSSTISGSVPFDARSILHDPAAGGGALLHSGCYAVHWMRTLAGGEPEVLAASVVRNPLDADVTTHAELRFPDGIQGRLTASFEGSSREPMLSIDFARGRLEVDGLIAPHHGHSLRTWIDGRGPIVRTVGGLASFDHQLDAVLRAMRGARDAIEEPLDPIGTATVMAAILDRAARAPREPV